MRIFETNLGLSYGEVAYFIKVTEKNYLCISENQEYLGKTYKVGRLEEFVETSGLDEVIKSKHAMILEQSIITGTFLFNEFIKNLKD